MSYRFFITACICIPVLLFSQNKNLFPGDKFPDHVPGEIIITYKTTGNQLPQGNQILLEHSNVMSAIQRDIDNPLKECKPVFGWLVKEMVKNNETEITLSERMLNVRNEKKQVQLNKFGFSPKVNNYQKNITGTLENSKILLLRLNDPEKTDEIINKLNGYRTSEFEIIRAEYNHLYQSNESPNDPLYPQQWAHTKTGADSAWLVSQGDPNIVIGIVDGGVDLFHEDLTDNLSSAYKGYDFVDVDTNGYAAYGWICFPGEDYVEPDSIPMDFGGHGTHCAGIAAARGNNGKGVIGVAPRCTIMPIRAGFDIKDPQGIEMGLLEDVAIANAIHYAVLHGADILSMSFGGEFEDPIITDEIDFAYSNGVVLVAAAGNTNLDMKNYPAASDHVISVSAVDQSLNRASFSTYGSWVDVAAPGVYILSTVPKSGGGLTNPSGYNYLSGTSMAAPYVAGLAALILSVNPNWTPDEVENIIKRSVTNPAEQSKYIGAGLVNLNNALHISSVSKSTAEILSPVNDALITSDVDILGKITGDEYRLYLGKGLYPSSWTFIAGGINPSNDTLGTFKIEGLPDMFYTLRLVAKDANGENEHRVFVRVFHAGSTLKVLDNFPVILYSGTSYYTADTKPIIFDINKDGKNELIILTNGWVHVLNSSGHDIIGWPKSVGGWVSFYTPAIADLNNDGFYEIIAVSSDGYYSIGSFYVHVWDCAGNSIPGWHWPLHFNYRVVDPVIADIDNDGKLNVILSDCNGWIYNYDNAGNLIWKQMISTGGMDNWLQNTAVGDLDGDGKLELVSLSANANIYIHNYMGQLIRSFPVNGAVSEVLIGDLNKDGRYEIITPLFSNISGMTNGVSVWDDTGNLIFTEDNNLGSVNASIGDINRDKYPEICFSSINYAGPGSSEAFTVVDHEGKDLPGWPQRIPGNVYSHSNIIIANINGDDFPEIIAGFKNGDVIIYNHDGTIYSMVSTGAFISSIAVGDLDNDNINELFVHSYDGKLYGWKLSNSPYKVIPKTWPMYMHDIHHTSNFNSNIDKLESGPEIIFVVNFSQLRQVNLGRVKLGQSKDITINIKDNSFDTLKISSIISSHSAFIIQNTEMTIPPWKSFNDTLHFTSETLGTVTASIVVNSNASSSPDTITFSGVGYGESHIQYDMQLIEFGKVKTREHKDTVLTITNVGNDTLKMTSIYSSQSEVVPLSSSGEIPPQKTFPLSIRFSPTTPTDLSAMLIVKSNSPDSPDTLWVTGIGSNGIPAEYSIDQNYPNPFNPSTTFSFGLPEQSFVKLKVFDLMGREVGTIVSEELPAGYYKQQWNAQDLSSGIYFYRLQARQTSGGQARTFTQTKKLLLLK
jgi:thermitase